VSSIAKLRGQQESSRFLYSSLLLWLYDNRNISKYSNHTITLWSSSTFPILGKDWEKSDRGKAAKKLYETPTLTWWIIIIYRVVTFVATTTNQRIGCNLR
jgi:hypothetical protein